MTWPRYVWTLTLGLNVGLLIGPTQVPAVNVVLVLAACSWFVASWVAS